MPDPNDDLLWTAKPPTPRKPTPGEVLFEFVRWRSLEMQRTPY